MSCNNLNFLDQASFNQFLDHSCKYNLTRQQTSFFDTNPHVVTKKAVNDVSVSSIRNSNVLNSALSAQANSFATTETLNFDQLAIDSQKN
jgi:hypothetical protein